MNTFRSYRCKPNMELPIEIFTVTEDIGTTIPPYIIGIRTKFNAKLSASSLAVKIPNPLRTTDVVCKATNGKAKYVPEEDVIVWK